jgi:hypothetical protein
VRVHRCFGRVVVRRFRLFARFLQVPRQLKSSLKRDFEIHFETNVGSVLLAGSFREEDHCVSPIKIWHDLVRSITRHLASVSRCVRFERVSSLISPRSRVSRTAAGIAEKTGFRYRRRNAAT